MFQLIFLPDGIVDLLQLVLNFINGDLSHEIELYIKYIYITMNKVKVEETTEITIKGIYGFIERKVTKFGSGGKGGLSQGVP